MLKNIDDTDKQIISLIQKNPEISQSEISEKVGISQPAARARINKLKENGLISFHTGVNHRKAGLYMAKVELSAPNTKDILDFFKVCPYFVGGLVLSGENNLCLFFISEDLSSLEALIDHHIRNDPLIKNIKLDIILSSNLEIIVPMKLDFKHSTINPCGTKCEGCYYFKEERCHGCPASTFYKGHVW